MKGVFNFKLDCGRMGALSGVFVAEIEEVEGLYGKNIEFGEVLGKHSDIRVEIDESMIRLASDDPNDVATVERLNLESGINPLNYYEPIEGEDED